jgi:hypothetical protein
MRKENTIQQSEVALLNMMLGQLKNQALSPDSFMYMLDLKIEMEEIALKYDKSVSELMRQYGITASNKDGQNYYEFGKSTKSGEIMEKLAAIDKKLIIIKSKKKFLNKHEFTSITVGLSLNDIVRLKNILLQ